MLTIYAPSNNPQSKCWEVFKGVEKTWPDETKVLDNSATGTFNSNLDEYMFWGFTGNNINLVHQIQDKKLNYWFTDTPYFGRFDNKNLLPDNHYWRICKNNIHVSYIENLDNKRFDKFNISINDERKNGEHILVCPSSAGIHNYLKKNNWLEQTVEKIKKHTDRPIVVRHKPRGRGTSGPSEATIPIEKELENAWACVTSCSISAVESLCNGIPVLCDPISFAASVCDTDYSKIENPKFIDPTSWLHSLSYQQFTPEEFSNGTAVSILKELKVL